MFIKGNNRADSYRTIIRRVHELNRGYLDRLSDDAAGAQLGVRDAAQLSWKDGDARAMLARIPAALFLLPLEQLFCDDPPALPARGAATDDFAVAALFGMWYCASRDARLTAFVFGVAETLVLRLASRPLNELPLLSQALTERLEPRFVDVPGFWVTLLNFHARGETDRLAAMQVSALHVAAGQLLGARGQLCGP
jgi:hypothetical protein